MVLKGEKQKWDESEFKIYSDVSDLPVKSKAAYLSEGISGVCTSGTAVIEVFSTPCLISKNDLVVILPMHLASIREVSDDFSITFFKVHKDLFLEILSGICKMTPDFFFYMRKKFRYPLTETDTKRFLYFCGLIDYRISEAEDEYVFRKETVIHFLRVFYLDFYRHYKRKPENRTSMRLSHKENISFKFISLIIEHHKLNRDVAFYANKLCISPKYLTQVMREVAGLSARDCIVEYVIIEMKALLRNADIDIKDLVRQTGFISQSAAAKFFRKYTGMSPSEYRDSITIG